MLSGFVKKKKKALKLKLKIEYAIIPGISWEKKIDSKLTVNKNYQCPLRANVLDKHSHKTSWPFGSDSEIIPSTAFKHPLRVFVPPEHFAVGLWYDLDPAITVCSQCLAPNPVAI